MKKILLIIVIIAILTIAISALIGLFKLICGPILDQIIYQTMAVTPSLGAKLAMQVAALSLALFEIYFYLYLKVKLATVKDKMIYFWEGLEFPMYEGYFTGAIVLLTFIGLAIFGVHGVMATKAMILVGMIICLLAGTVNGILYVSLRFDSDFKEALSGSLACGCLSGIVLGLLVVTETSLLTGLIFAGIGSLIFSAAVFVVCVPFVLIRELLQA